MKRNHFKRFACAATAAAICAGAVFAFAGCTTKHPEITVTYTFNGTDYAVAYRLSRNDAPRTVQHFIEVADTGFYDGMCVHDYGDSKIHTGGYTLENGALVEKDYFSAMKAAEEEGTKFSQSVWANGNDVVSSSPVFTTADDTMTPLYTVYGEFSNNGNNLTHARENVHEFGALVMYYNAEKQPENGANPPRVTTLRNDGGKNNGGDKYDKDKSYVYNSATSLFYTFTGQSNATLDSQYCVFGKVTDAGSKKLQELIDAIDKYQDDLSEDAAFTDTTLIGPSEYLQYEPIERIKTSGLNAEYETPVDVPILIKSVKVNKY